MKKNMKRHIAAIEGGGGWLWRWWWLNCDINGQIDTQVEIE